MNNRLISNLNGIVLVDANSCIISNNNCTSNYNGIYLFKSKINTINNNTCNSNSMDGIAVGYQSTNNTILNNTIKSNSGSGINIFNEVENNLIYNNHFDNNRNHNIYSGWEQKNSWNIAKTSGRNIIGGPYLGGNYWSNYSGVDNDGDGLGDTYVPFNDGDNHPLVKIHIIVPPIINDKTNQIPTTGDRFTFNATVLDVNVITNVYVEYWFDSGKPENETMEKIRGNNINADYAKNITVPNHAFELYYFISGTDLVGIWNRTIQKVLEVMDNDPPIIVDGTETVPTTGDEFTYNISVTDNMNVSEVYLEFWFDSGSNKNLTLSKEGIFYNTTVSVPSNAEILSYMISANDTSDNWAVPKLTILDVIDNDKPLISDQSGTPTTGDNFTFNFEITDNIEISMASLEYWIDERTHNNITLPKDTSYPIILPPDAITLYYLVTALDTSDNIVQLKVTKPVVDNDPPVIEDLTSGNPKTGRAFIIKCLVFENRMIENVTIEYWFDERDSTLTSFNSKEGVYYLEIEAGINAANLQYIITAEDAGNNIAQHSNSLPVIDIIPPTITELTDAVPTTGEVFVIKGYAKDNIGVESLHLEYWFDSNEHLNISFNESRTVNVPSNAIELYYIFHAVDVNHNTALFKKNINVIDNDKPKIKDFSKKDGKNYQFSVKVTDNIKVYEVTVNYWFRGGNISTITLLKNNNSYEYLLSVPEDTEYLYYTIYADDASGNWERTNEIAINFTQAPVDTEQPTLPETEPTTPTKTSERTEHWVLLIIIIIIIIILVGVGVYSYYKKKKYMKQESPFTKAQTIKPGAISPPVLSYATGPSTSMQMLTPVASTLSTTSAQPEQTSTISVPKLSGSAATSSVQTTQQIPQVAKLPQLPPVQKNETKPEISKTTPEPGISPLIPQVVQQTQNPEINEPPTTTETQPVDSTPAPTTTVQSPKLHQNNN